MFTRKQSRLILENTWEMTFPELPKPHFVLSRSDKDNTASAEISKCILTEIKSNKEKTFKFIEEMVFPNRHWRLVSKNILRIQVLIEKANLDINDPEFVDAIESTQDDEIAKANKRYRNYPNILANEINAINYKYEKKWHIIDVQLAKKLLGDEIVFKLCKRFKYDPNWIIEYFDILINESYDRIRPEDRIHPRVTALKLRIKHINFLIKGNKKEAQCIRQKQSALAEKRLSEFAPSTVQ